MSDEVATENAIVKSSRTPPFVLILLGELELLAIRAMAFATLLKGKNV